MISAIGRVHRIKPRSYLAALLAAVSVAAPASAATSQEGLSDLVTIDQSGRSRHFVLHNVGVRGWSIYDISRDGHRLVFARAGLYVARVDGRDVHKVAIPGSGIAAAVWSPDERKLAVVTAGGLWAIDVSTGAASHVSTDANDPAWSPDSRRLVFLGRWDTNTGSGVLTVANVNGTGRRELAPFGSGMDVAWSPRGNLIAYATAPTGAIGTRRVTVVSVATRATRTVGPGLQPAWSPDGRRLVYVALLGHTYAARRALRIVSASGGRGRVVDEAPYLAFPQWSPDGASLAYVGRAGRSDEIFVGSTTERQRRQVTHERDAILDGVLWLPGGRQLLYLREPPG
jgi:Tol biopolymer transport system component